VAFPQPLPRRSAVSIAEKAAGSIPKYPNDARHILRRFKDPDDRLQRFTTSSIAGGPRQFDDLKEVLSMQVSVECTLRYTLAEETGFVFQIQAAIAEKQTISAEAISIPVSAGKKFFTAYTDPVTLTRVIRAMLGPGDVAVGYQATVNLEANSVDPNDVYEFDFTELPMEYLTYLAPSRYCPSDVFSQFA